MNTYYGGISLNFHNPFNHPSFARYSSHHITAAIAPSTCDNFAQRKTIVKSFHNLVIELTQDVVPSIVRWYME